MKTVFSQSKTVEFQHKQSMGTAEMRMRRRRCKEILVPKIERRTYKVRSHTINSGQENIYFDKVTNSYYYFCIFCRLCPQNGRY